MKYIISIWGLPVWFTWSRQSKVGPSVDDPGNDANINIQGTINLLELCRKNNIKSFVYASSAAVYGHAEATSYY